MRQIVGRPTIAANPPAGLGPKPQLAVNRVKVSKGSFNVGQRVEFTFGDKSNRADDKARR